MVSSHLQQTGLSIAKRHVPTACIATVSTVSGSTLKADFRFKDELALYDLIRGTAKARACIVTFLERVTLAHRFPAGCFQLQRALFDRLCISKVQLRSRIESEEYATLQYLSPKHEGS